MLDIKNWEQAIEIAIMDPSVGISSARLSGDDNFAMYVTRIAPNKKVGAHVHAEGLEIYQILSGYGTMATANSIGTKFLNSVKEGDFFTVPQGIIHQLKNTGSTDLILVFGCPITHLSTDRVLIEDII